MKEANRVPCDISFIRADRARSTLSGSSSFPRHKRRSRNGRRYINWLLIFRKTPEVRDEVRKAREQTKAILQRLGRTFRRGNERADLFQSSGLGVELVQPEELALFIDPQKPPLAVV